MPKKKRGGLKRGQNIWWLKQMRGYHGHFTSVLDEVDKIRKGKK